MNAAFVARPIATLGGVDRDPENRKNRWSMRKEKSLCRFMIGIDDAPRRATSQKLKDGTWLYLGT